MQKRAQVTVFLIIGLVIIISIVIFLYMRKGSVESKLETDVQGKSSSKEQDALRNFMDNCIRDAIYNGADILTLQAGYIDLPEEVMTVKIKDEQGKQITEINGIKKVIIDPDGEGNDVPYWLDSRNNLFIPTTPFIKESLASYMHEGILNCVNDFNSFRKQGYNVSYGDPKVNIEFTDSIIADINFPIRFSKKDLAFSESEFGIRIPVNIKQAIDVQTEIVLYEYLANFLEEDVKYLISAYSYYGGDKGEYDLPPFSFVDVNTDCRSVSWKLSEAKDKMIDNIMVNSQYFQIKGLGDNGEKSALTSYALKNQYDNTRAEFIILPDTKETAYFDVMPKSGNTINPDRFMGKGIKFLPLFCNVKYQFKYTMAFPVISKITLESFNSIDTASARMSKDEYSFNVPIGFSLCGNQPRKCTGKPAYLQQVMEDFNISSEDLNFSIQGESMFCEDDMRLSSPYKITVADNYNKSKISGAALFFKCAETNECLIDTTDRNGTVESSLPLCVNGEIYAIKEGYSQNGEIITTQSNEETEVNKTKTLNIFIEPAKELSVEVQLIDVQKVLEDYFMKENCDEGSLVVNKYLVALTDKNVIISSDKSDSFVNYPDSDKIKLTSGEQTFSYLVEGTATVMPYEYQGQKYNLGKEGPYQGSYLFGSYELSVEIKSDELRSAKKITFFVPVESASDVIRLEEGNAIQPDGMLAKNLLVDDDCDGDTEKQKVLVEMSKDEFMAMIRPTIK